MERLTATVESLASLDVKDAAAIRAFMKDAALARPVADAVLDVTGWLNPLFADDVRALFAGPLPQLLAVDAKSFTKLTRKDWERAKAAMAPALTHDEKKPKDLPGGLAGDALQALLDGDAPRKLAQLITEDGSVSEELKGLKDLEHLALLQRWLLDVANNMVSFPALFRVGERCLFEAGTLVLDGRDMSFCVKVSDRGAHKAVAEHSNIFVVYVDLDRKDGDVTKTQQVVAAVTSGTRRGIAPGKRGVFYDRDGKEWDARIVDIIVKPISLWEAAISPFVRMKDFVAERIEKLTASKLEGMEKGATERAGAQVDAAHATATTLPAVPAPAPAAVAVATAPAPAAAPAGGGLQSLLVGGGIAFAAIGSAAAFALQTLSSIDPLNALGAILAVVAGIMLLSGFLGWLKLRKRDLSTLLEAGGWAFNVRIYLTRRHSLRFTHVPPLPAGSVRERVLLAAVASDEGPSRLFWWLGGAILVAVAIESVWYFGLLR